MALEPTTFHEVINPASVSGVTNANGEIVSNLMPESIFDKKFGDLN